MHNILVAMAKNHLKRVAQATVLLMSYAMVLSTPAAALFNITTADTNLTVAPGDSLSITYTVRNNSGITLNNPYFLPTQCLHHIATFQLR